MRASRTIRFYASAVIIAAAMLTTLFNIKFAAAVDPLNPLTTCSVFDPAPCAPSYCGVFSGSPCVPYNLPPIGQDLHLTIASRNADHGRTPEGQVDSIRELFAALRACWEPPIGDDAHHGVQISVRFSFKRTGEIIDTPRVTYTSRDAGDDTRRMFRQAVTAALDRCTPMPFSKGLGGAIAGRPIAIRFIDDRADPAR